LTSLKQLQKKQLHKQKDWPSLR